jgi:hypothetical protein
MKAVILCRNYMAGRRVGDIGDFEIYLEVVYG